MDGRDLVELTPLEIAAGFPWGERDDDFRVPERTSLTPRQALEAVLLPCLDPGPCFVAFSGGQDSSALLAVAVDIARREGLSLPVPVTLAFDGVELADETTWQEAVLSDLDIEERIRIDGRHDLELLGETARDTLRALGPMWPHNTYLFVPMLEVAREGRLITGLGGDDFFLSWPRRHVWHGGGPGPAWRRIPRRLLGVTPRPLRLARAALSRQGRAPWLRRAAAVHVSRALRAERASHPLRWDRQIRWVARRRRNAAVVETLRRIAAWCGVDVILPYWDLDFLAAAAAAGGAGGFRSRGDALVALLGNVVPECVAARTTKAVLTVPLWGPGVREFAETWDGTGVDLTLIDAERLREEWLAPLPSASTGVLLHIAWWTGRR